MKKLYSTLLLVLFTSISFAQAPQGFNYQSVVRDNLGNLIANTGISVEFQLHQTTITGTVVYTETHSVTTSDYGVFNTIVGQGTTTDDFTTIDWGSDSYFIETSIDITGGSTFVSLGTTQMMSVPYALYAKTAENVINDNGCIYSPNGVYMLCIQDDGNVVSRNVSTMNIGWMSGAFGY